MSHAATIHGKQYGTGKRKNAIARVFLKSGTGVVTVNGRTVEDYFPRETLRFVIQHPFVVIDKTDQYDVEANVSGGGISAQAQAIRHGISRALVHASQEVRSPLKKEGLLTRDDRKKERKKPGQPAARKRFQYSKR